METSGLVQNGGLLPNADFAGEATNQSVVIWLELGMLLFVAGLLISFILGITHEGGGNHSAAVPTVVLQGNLER
jgi:hypothetical protein